MAYERETEEEVNFDAYVPNLRNEQAGVAHLVHGWVQRGNEEKVCYVFCKLNAIKYIDRGFLYLEILRVPAPRCLQ